MADKITNIVDQKAIAQLEKLYRKIQKCIDAQRTLNIELERGHNLQAQINNGK